MNSLPEPVSDHNITVRVTDASDKMYLHMTVFEVGQEGEEPRLTVSSGTGLGGDFITIDYLDSEGKKRRGVAYMRELASGWIKAIDPGADPELLKALNRKARRRDEHESQDQPSGT